MSKAIDKETYKRWFDINDKFYKENSRRTKEDISQRVDDIIILLIGTLRLNAPDDWWWEFQYEDNPFLSISEDYICFTQGNDCSHLDISVPGTDLQYNYGIPIEFLFMKDKEIVDMIEAEMKVIEDKKRKKKERAKQLKENKQKIKEQALAKLTNDEKKVLGIK